MTSPSERAQSPAAGFVRCACGAFALGRARRAGLRTARADWEIGASAGAFYDDNLTRAQNRADKRAAGAATANVSATYFVPFTGSDGVTVTLYGRGELFERYNGLANLVGGATAAYRHKFGSVRSRPGSRFRSTRPTTTTATTCARARGSKYAPRRASASASNSTRRSAFTTSVATMTTANRSCRASPARCSTLRDRARSCAPAMRRPTSSSSTRGPACAAATSSRPRSAACRSSARRAPSPTIPCGAIPSCIAYRLRGTTWSGAVDGELRAVGPVVARRRVPLRLHARGAGPRVHDRTRSS